MAILSNLMMLLSLLAGFYLVSADVIRDDWYNNYEGQFTIIRKGRMLRVLMYFNNVQQEECALHCVRHLRCRTFNYDLVKKACELTDEDFNKMDADKISPGWYNHGTPPKVNGGWGTWKNFTDCTKTCGNGTLEQWRDCDSPIPDHGGVDCKGRKRRRVKCNTEDCPVVNVALYKKAVHSSTFGNNNKYSASKAVDGNARTHACTKYEYAPWFEVDLEEIRMIRYMILNALAHTGNNKGILVETRKTKDKSWILCKDIKDVKKGKEVTKFSCINQSTEAQFLRIRSTTWSHVNIYEIEIFGH